MQLYTFTMVCFGPPCSFTGLVQRIFNRDKIQDNNVTSDKLVLNIFIQRGPKKRCQHIFAFIIVTP